MNSQVAILKEALDLLGGLLEEWRARGIGEGKRDIQRSYINRHEWNIHGMGNDLPVFAYSSG